MIRSAAQLSQMRRSMRTDFTHDSDAVPIVDDFITAVNEVVTAALGEVDDVGDGGSGAIDVRWMRRTHPRAELQAEVRNTSGPFRTLVDDGIASRLLEGLAERVEIDQRIGGSVITVRHRV